MVVEKRLEVGAHALAGKIDGLNFKRVPFELVIAAAGDNQVYFSRGFIGASALHEWHFFCGLYGFRIEFDDFCQPANKHHLLVETCGACNHRIADSLAASVMVRLSVALN